MSSLATQIITWLPTVVAGTAIWYRSDLGYVQMCVWWSVVLVPWVGPLIYGGTVVYSQLRPVGAMAWAFGLVILYTFLPLANALVWSAVARLGDCAVGEILPAPCHILGFDVGEALTSSTYIVVLSMCTVPTGLATLGVLILLQLRRLRRSGR